MMQDKACSNEQHGHSVHTNWSQNVRTKRVNVLLVRHGEREDEAYGYKKRKVLISRKDAVDPHLTRTGFDQAKGAFENLSRYYNEQASTIQSRNVTQEHCSDDNEAVSKKKKVFVFSSPMRRTIGTALMSSYLFSNDNDNIKSNNIDLGLPCNQRNIKTETQEQEARRSHSNQVEGDIANIIVMDGLCDCAAAIRKCGGATSAISMGYVDCAARVNKIKDYNAEESLRESLQDMIMIAKPTAGLFRNRKDNFQSSARNTSICLWREKKYDIFSHDQPTKDYFEPMTCNFNINGDGIISPHNIVSYEDKNVQFETPPRKPLPLQQNYIQSIHSETICPSEETFLGAINRAAYFTAKSGCNDCIIVTHREGMRYLAKHVCGYGHHARSPDPKEYNHPSNLDYYEKLKTPYCSIGTYVADVKFNLPCSSDSPSRVRPFYNVKWKFNGIVPYSDFPTTLMKSTSKKSLHKNLAISDNISPLQMTVKTKRGEINGLCDVDVTPLAFPYDNSKQYCVKCIHINAFKSLYDSDRITTIHNKLHKLPIKDGSRSLLHFFGFLNKEILLAEGYIEYSITNDRCDGETLQQVPFVLAMLDQPKLPCPPSYLYIKTINDSEQNTSN